MIDQGSNAISVRLLRAFLMGAMRVLFRIEHRGLGNIPANGPLVIAPNHVTYFDPFWVGAPIRRAVCFMAWDKIFKIPVAGRMFRWLGAFPVSLVNPESSAYKTALSVLQSGKALMVFPEGGRSESGTLQHFKEGAARLALKTGATVLPVAIHGGARVWSPKMWFPRPRKVQVAYLRPISCPRFETRSKEEFEAAAATLTAEIRVAIESQLQTSDLRPQTSPF
jgi:1-acyl-sn-glycerol-3-phosphate acyltransferase